MNYWSTPRQVWNHQSQVLRTIADFKRGNGKVSPYFALVLPGILEHFSEKIEVIQKDASVGGVTLQLADDLSSDAKSCMLDEHDFWPLVEHAPDAIFIQTDWKFAYINCQGLKLFGADTPAQLLMTPVMDRIHQDDREKVTNRVKGLNEKRQIQAPEELRMIKLDGHPVSVQTVGLPFKFNNVGGALVFVKDLTEINQTKELLKIALLKAEETKSLKLSFLQNLSHEINTPLNSIKGFVDLLTTPNLSSEKQEEFIKIIHYNIESLSSLIYKTVSMSLLDTHQEIPTPVLFSVDIVLEDLYDHFFRSAQIKHIDFVLSKPIGSSEVKIFSDSKKVYEVLLNFLENAFKFTDSGKIELGYKVISGGVEFYVKDTGSGIPKAYQEMIYERFFQIESPLTKSHSGTGLGLSISKALSDLLGGKIWYESEESRGSTFYFYVPSMPK